MPKGKVIHHQRVIGRIFRAAEAAEYPVEQIEFCPDGTIIVRPRATTSSAKSHESELDKWLGEHPDEGQTQGHQ